MKDNNNKYKDLLKEALEYSNNYAGPDPLTLKLYDDLRTDKYEDAPTISSSRKSLLGRIGDSVSEIGSDLIDSGRLWTKRFITQRIEGDRSRIGDVNQEQEDLQMIEDYKNLQLRLQDLKTRPQFSKSGMRIPAEQIFSEIKEIEQKIKEYDDYFMGEGRSHTVIAQQMFDINKMNALDKAYVNAAYMAKDIDKTNYLDGSVKGFFKQLGAHTENIFAGAGGFIDWATTTFRQGVDNINPFVDNKEINGYKTGEVVKRLDENNKEDRAFLEKLYKGSIFNVNDISTSIDNDRINDWREYNNRKINELTATLKADEQFAKDGKLWGIDIYDPERLPKQFEQAQQEFGKNWYDYFIHPYDAFIYSLPETASTVGLMQNQFAAMGTNALLLYIAKEAPVWALGGSGKALKGLGIFAKSGVGQLTMEVAGVSAGIDAAIKSRKDETALEAIGAISERVANAVEKNGGDFEKIYNAVLSKADAMGIDASNFEVNDVIQFAIAYNLNTGDEVFDFAKKEARKGINKLINSNNALAIVDYLQVLPFMSYSGSVLNKWAKTAFGGNLGYRPAAAVVLNSKPIMQSVSDVTVGKIANKFIKDGRINTGLRIKHTGEYVLNKIPLVAGEAFSEGLEEVNQEILQDRYKRKLYDEYNKQPNMLDIHEVFGNVNMSFEGLAAYAGFHPLDPELNVENIRRAFHIGAATSGMFAGFMRGITNVTKSDHPNMRNLLAQLKNDKYISNIVANYYNQVQDQQHLELFFDAFTKAGVDRSRLTKALTDLRDAVDENNTLVNKDFVNSDIQLMNAAWSIYNNNEINEALKANGIEKYSDLHKQLVVDGAAAIVESQKTQEQIQEGDRKIQDILNRHINLVEQMLSENTSQERLKEIEEENPELANIILGLRLDYLDYKRSRDASNLGKFAAFSRKFDSVKKFAEHEGVRDYITKRGLSEETVSRENEEGYDPLIEEARNIFANNKERKAALRHAFNYENRKSYGERLLNEREFMRNKYVRQYAREQVAVEQDLNRKLQELYNDKSKREQAIDAAYERFDNGTYSLNDYVIERIHLLHLHNRMQRLRYARDVAADKHRRNMEIRKRTGLDVYTGLEGIIDALDRELEYYKKMQDRHLNRPGTPENEKIIYADLFKDKDYKFDDQQEFDQEFSTLVLNKAILGPQRIVAGAYLMGYAMPTSLSNAIFGENAKESGLSDLVDQYNQILAEERAEFDQESEVVNVGKAAARKRDKQALEKKAAWAIIKNRLDEKLKRRRIANRLFEEEGPITPAMEERMQNLAEEEAKIVAETKPETASEEYSPSISVQEPAMSEAEKRLNEKYNHARGKLKTVAERAEERRKRRQQAAVEDALEPTEESETPEITDEETETAETTTPESRRAAAVVEDELDNSEETETEILPEEDEVVNESEEVEEDEVIPEVIDKEEEIKEESENNIVEEEFDPNEGESEEFIPEDINEDAEQSMIDAEAATAEFEEEASLNDVTLENGWVLIDDYSELEVNDEGFLTYEGQVLPEDQQQVVMDDILLLGLTEQFGFDQEELPDGVNRTGEDNRRIASNDKLSDLVSQTFFYQPNPRINEETGQDELPKLTVDGKEVVFDKPLASGRQLSEKLSKPGWLNSTKKYFIVTQSQQGRNVAKDKDVRDAMTVALVIEDENNSYVTFLRPLGLTESEGYGREGSVFVNSETALRNWLLSRHVDWRQVLEAINDDLYSYTSGQIYKRGSKYPLTSSLKVNLYKQAVAKLSLERGRSQYYANYGTTDGFEHWWTNDPIRSDFRDDESWAKAVAERHRVRNLIVERSRQSLAHAGKQLLSDNQVNEQINRLRTYRNQIIDAYLIKKTENGKTVYKFPKTIKKTVTPAKVLQSNGKVNSKKDKFRNPIYRTLSDTNATIEDIQSQLETGEITLGYGLGMFGQDPYVIRGLLDDQATSTFNGKGLSGKIYMMVKGPSGAEQRIPIMLAEEKFDTQVQIVDGKPKTIWLNNPNNLVLCLKKNPQTGEFENVNTQGYQPSAAEIIFYMLINQMGVGLDAERHAEMVEFFIHSGEKTLLKNQPKSGNDPFNVLGRKQLAWHTEGDNQVLTIGINDGNGRWVAQDYTTEEMMAPTEEGENLRRQIISAIATQMHWNTDLAHMNSSINVLGTSNTSVAQLFNWAIAKFAKEYDDVNDYLNQRIEIFGCPQLSFRLGDFFTNKKDEIVPKENVSILAWMIKEGKIKTDVGENAFTAPFVFANGVAVEGGAIETETSKVAEIATGNSEEQVINITTPKVTTNKKNPVTITALDLYNQQAQDEMFAGQRKGFEQRVRKEGWYVAKTEEERKAVLDSINETKSAKDNGGINDRIMIRSPKQTIPLTKAVDEFKKIIKKFLEEYNKSYSEKAVNIEDININQLVSDLIKEQWATKKGFVILDLYKNGKINIQVRKYADLGNWRNPVTGIFSTNIGGHGTFNFEKAKKWLSETLGIDENNVVLTKAIMRSATNEDVFGLTNVVLDRIAGEVTGYMKFSDQADAGVEYHEAWHYVNLLMHDKNTRDRIYESYIKTHKALRKPGVKIKDVEEAMADDFKVYMEGFTDKSISGKVRRLFSNILDFLIASRRKSAYRNAFKAIANKKYAGVKLDRSSVQEFLNRYKQGVASVSHSVPGLTKAELDKMTNVRTYQDILDGTNAVINRVFAELDLTSPKKMQAVANDGFVKVLQIVDNMIGEQSDENKIAKLQDIRDNERFLRKALIDAFMELGIIAKVKKATDVQQTERTEINEDALKKEDDADNTWDKFTLTSQRKENAQLNTKMFLRQIPMYTKQYMEDGSVLYIAERDDYGTIRMHDSDQAWRKILDTLWMCDSYAERDENGQYSPSSIMGIVESYKNIDPFFYSLFNKLQELDYSSEYGDIQLKSQILATVNSSKNLIQVIKIQNPIETKVAFDEDFQFTEEEQVTFDDNGVVADKKRQWLIQNDSLVSVARNIPRRWSKNLASNGLLGFNSSKNESVVDKNFANSIEKDLNKIQKKIAKYTSKKKKGFVPRSDEELQRVLDELKPQVVQFYNKLGIESDMQSLNVYLALISELENELTPQQQIDTLNDIFNTSKIGSISYVIEGIVENIGNSEVTHSGSKYARAIDEAFSEYSADSQIGILALAWSAVHPSSQEFSVKDANGNRLYPINLNNYISDRVRALNNRRSGYIERLQKASYAKHSIIADAAKQVKVKNPKSKIKLNTFVGIRDANIARGADYFGITAAEDYIAKLCMTEDDQIIFPTMADKKTWNSLSSENIKLTHDVMVVSSLEKDLKKYIYKAYSEIQPYLPVKYTNERAWKREAEKWYRKLEEDDEIRKAIDISAVNELESRRTASIGFDLNNGTVTARFQDTTLNRFANYFLDELNTLIDYYSKDSIKKAVSNKNNRIENYHGKVKDGRMDFSGNGGKFRYFYDIPLPILEHNLNHTLQGLFELQKKIESGNTLDRSKQEGDIRPYIGTSVLGQENLDGFELIREYLQDLKKTYFNRIGMATPELLNAINKKLVDQTEQELQMLSKSGPLQLVEFNKSKGLYIPKGIPEQLLDRYTKILQENEYGSFGKAYDSEDLLHHALFSLIGSHVANTATSIIEVEKIFSGDPAFYKKKAYKDGRKTSKITITRNFGESLAIEEVEVENLEDTFSDKIKRLGGTLSPGQELRLDFDEMELEFDPTLACTKYTNLNIEDINVPSLFLDEIEYNFKRQLVINAIRSNTPKGFSTFLTELQNARTKENERLKKEGKKQKSSIDAENAIDRIYSDQNMFKKMWNLLTDGERSSIESMLSQQMRPYKDITVSDAQVFIRPALYRKIRISLGMWSTEADETGYSDEAAYNIIEGIIVDEYGNRVRSENPSDDWTRDPKLYEMVRRLQLFPLKMSYFQNDSEQVTDKISINRPIYNKMAIFPLFAFQRSTSVGKALYDRMNQKENELDMISFKSAVKVGAVQKGADVVDNNADVKDVLGSLSEQLNLRSDKHLDYTTGEVVQGTESNTVAVTVQDLSNIRMQLNTQAHDAEIRSIGTQMFKIAFSNIIDDAFYGTGKTGRKVRKGSNVKRDVISCINALTRIGIEDIRERFYKDNHIDDAEVDAFIKTVIRNNGLGTAAEEIIANGGVAAGIISRTVFENSTSAIVNSDVVNINTKGGTAIQQSIFGFVGHSNVGTLSYNSGVELKWSAEEGSMQVILGMNFFKPVIPNYNNLTHEQRRQWLIDHNVIGEKAKPFGIGYRIPTQGMSSMFAFLVVDVLPEQVADLIIVPREFTALTGSDFDVDKLYLATMSYKDGVLETLSNEAFNKRGRSFEEALDVAEDRMLALGVEADEIDVTQWLDEASDITKEDIRGAISNRLLLNYIDIISDVRNYANSRGSIDVITNMIHDQLLNPVLKTRSENYTEGMKELLPSFLSMRKMEFGVGKSGIGPFALNITNHALTQYTHLTIDFGNIGEEYGFRALDEIYDKDGNLISDWLSAMVNAHVDVAKDPYVFDLNLNQSTYNHANLLLRTGMGMSTFTFLAQPALKDLANTINNAGGLYGDNIEGEVQNTQEFQSRKKKIYRRKLNYYSKILENAINKYKDSISKQTLAKAENVLEYYQYLTMSQEDRRKAGYTNENRPTRSISRTDMFSEEIGKKAILSFNIGSDLTEDNAEASINSLMHLLAVLESFMEIDTFAQQMSSLVKCSQIDTKKFGNTIHEQIDFVNKYDAFRLSSTMFTINDPEFLKSLTPRDEKKGLTKEEISTAALNKYFNDLYLNMKLHAATRYTREIISRQLFSATDTYESLFKNILGIINGFDQRMEIGGLLNVGYNTVYNKESIDSFADGLDNMMRFNSFMTIGPSVYQNAVTRNGSTDMIDFTLGGDMNAVVNKFKELTIGTKDTKSIFVRLADFINQLKKDPYSDQAEGLVDAEGNIINDLLLYLNPQTPTDKYPIGRMLLLNSLTENKSSEERRLISAFSLLLSHPNQEVQDLAKDIAFYAYFSTYDQNTANSFFHLVPFEYRKQYDLALKNSLKALSSKKPKTKAAAIKNAGGLVSSDISIADAEMQAAANIIDVLSRNYWFDDNIVPVHYTTNSPAENRFQSGIKESQEFTGPSIYDAESGRTFPTYIATTRVMNNSIYIKLRKGSGTFLYKRVGVVNRSYTDKKGNQKQTTPYSIYIAIPKAGMHVNGINQFELYANYTTPSIFSLNRLEMDYAEDLVRKDIEELVNDLKDGQYNLELNWDNEQIPDMYVSSNRTTYLEDTTQSTNKRKIAGVSVYSKKNPEKIGQKNATVILDIVSTSTEGEINRPNIIGEYKDKVVELSLDKDIDDIIEEIRKISDSDLSIHITSSMYDGEFAVSDEMVEEYIKEELAKYAQTLGSEVQDVESMLNAKENMLRNNKYTKRNIALNIINQKLHDLTQQLILSGATISRYSAAAYDGKTILSKAISFIKNVDGTYLNSDRNAVFVHKDLVSKTKKFKSLLSQLDYTPNRSIEQEQQATVLISEEKLEDSETKVQEVVEKQSARSKFAAAATDMLEESEEEVIPEILKEAQEKEDNKEESNNQQCGSGGRNKFAKGATSIIED